MTTYDVVVAGGSVAGAAAAIELARRGLRVALVEKARFPRFKACGEGLLPHGVAALARLGLEAPGIPFRGMRYVSPSGIVAEADFPHGQGRVVRRDRFDEMLFRAAAATPGVEAFPEMAYDPERWTAKWIVGADGLHSQFHRRAEFSAAFRRPARAGLSTHVRGLQVDRERVEVILHSRGEVYVAPSDEDHALVACLALGEEMPAGRTNEERVESLLRSLPVLRERIGQLEFTTPCLGVAPLGLRVRSVAAGNVFLIGDASGAPDPVTGEGMSLALRSAPALADAIVAERPEDYARERRRLGEGPDWLGRWLLRAVRFPAVADAVVRSLAARPESFRRLLEVAVGDRPPSDVGLLELARLVI